MHSTRTRAIGPRSDGRYIAVVGKAARDLEEAELPSRGRDLLRVFVRAAERDPRLEPRPRLDRVPSRPSRARVSARPGGGRDHCPSCLDANLTDLVRGDAGRWPRSTFPPRQDNDNGRCCHERGKEAPKDIVAHLPRQPEES